LGGHRVNSHNLLGLGLDIGRGASAIDFPIILLI